MKWRTELLAGAAAVVALWGLWLVLEASPMPARTDAPSGAQAPAALPQATLDARARAPAHDTLLQAADLRHRLEAALLDAGEPASAEALRALLPGLVARHFAPAEQVRALALLERYVGYRVALGRITPPRDPSDPQALRRAIEARRELRERHFDGEENAALFGAEDALDRYTLARLEIERHPTLTASQKEEALRQAQAELPADQRAAREEAVAHLHVLGETAAFEAQRLSEAERYAARRARYGDAAALRLSELDRDEAQWQDRLTQYAQAVDRGAPEPALDVLRRQLFTPAEQLRLEAALTMRQAAPNAPTR